MRERFMDRKQARERDSYISFEKEQSNKDFWYSLAKTYHESALVLDRNRNEIHQGIRAFLFNAALSLELLFKAIIVAKGQDIPNRHDLRDLAKTAGISFSDNQRTTLEMLSEVLIWRGRYPTPTKESSWDHYYSQVEKKHLKIERSGNTWRTLANRETFPTLQNYEKLWNQTDPKWLELEGPNSESTI